MNWLSQPHKMKATPKEEFRLQLFYSSALDIERQIYILEDQLKQHQDRLEYLKKSQLEIGEVPKKGTYEFSDYLVLLGAIKREEGMCDWLNECINMCKEN